MNDVWSYLCLSISYFFNLCLSILFTFLSKKFGEVKYISSLKKEQGQDGACVIRARGWAEVGKRSQIEQYALI